MDKIQIVKNDVLNFDISNLVSFVHPEDRKHYTLPRNKKQGKTPYKLLAYLSTKFNDIKILDLGTRNGSSAIALSYNESNIVDSYDTNKGYIGWCNKNIKKDNINFIHDNLLETEEKLNKLLQYILISLDVDPHNGIQEKKVLDYLIENNYSGIVVCDDISNTWPKLHKWWNGIKDINKYDLTEIGHWSGTGLLDFTKSIEII